MNISMVRSDEEALTRHLSIAITQIVAAGNVAGQEIEGSYRSSAQREFDECLVLLDKIKKEAGLK